MTMAVEPPDPYAALGLTREATPEQIKHAYRSLLRLNHPDTSGGQDVVEGRGPGEALRQIIDAYAVLGDAQRRAGYDRSIAEAESSASTIRARYRQASWQRPMQPWIRVGPVLWDPVVRLRSARARRGTHPA
ncbi:J domain-containing protein [Terrabacter sp. MAHUQ-38]|uniref:J domain-containing protein n=1 Tax=unclassified Terrabacter TaxID=2630222 RepID=UPI00165E703C|nr:J domain-containing protein [Terrabacter sp. MAHUQ-38]MBC9822627.1 J domain-containing protein [Terrabacter sp. MAHUQ-38]